MDLHFIQTPHLCTQMENLHVLLNNPVNIVYLYNDIDVLQLEIKLRE